MCHCPNLCQLLEYFCLSQKLRHIILAVNFWYFFPFILICGAHLKSPYSISWPTLGSKATTFKYQETYAQSFQFPFRVDIPLVTLTVEDEWKSAEDAKVIFKLMPNYHRSGWDWIGLYKVTCPTATSPLESLSANAPADVISSEIITCCYLVVAPTGGFQAP